MSVKNVYDILSGKCRVKVTPVLCSRLLLNKMTGDIIIVKLGEYILLEYIKNYFKFFKL